MSALDKSDLQRFAVSSVGALLLSAACVVAAVGPARAAEVAPHAAGVERAPVQATIR